ncbi:extensin family protein [Pacificimonas sp. WHA3]|uniref:Extensin family protein n=1 Tax=Pacificimonas pallii TaxID=2827236 RepID=A0ABS6SGZ4_9SPHN|nr:extensin family protein [Pacificimonas pallii]MBV7257161.1 extensin family protein [Pacificimonas pallii]
MTKLLTALTLLAGIIFAGWQARLYAEREFPQELPWTPLVLEQPVGAATKFKIAQLSGDKPACLALFEGSTLSITALDDRDTAPNCGFVDAVALGQMSASYTPGTVRLACPLAAALAIWEVNALQPTAERTLGSRIVGIDHYGTYSCRRMYGASTGRWSKHATAEAIDIAGFRTADGRRITLARDWGTDSDAGAFLEAIRTEGCDIVGTVLGPDYNAAHADHFHLQAGAIGTCR